MLDIDTLRQVPLFAGLVDRQLHWLLEQGIEVWRQPGEVHRYEGDPADHVFVLLEGIIQIKQKVGNQEILLATYDTKTLFGELPVLMGQEYFWASGRALTQCHIFELPNKVFWELLSSCNCVLTAILRTMAERLQEIQSISQHREKLVALGTLAAGLAHELNNPASACRRTAFQLRETVKVLPPLTLKLSQQQMTSAQQVFLAGLQREVMTRTTTSAKEKLDPLTQSDREDEVIDWLEAHDISEGWKIAPTVVAAGFDINWLDNLKQNLANDLLLGDVLTWIEAMQTEVELVDEIEQSSDRISKLVQAVKDYSYMDQAPLQEVDVHQGIESTLTILSHKLKQGVVVIREYGCNLPRISAYGSELNQVWTNLIDNAIDALQEVKDHGELRNIRIRTCCESDFLLVEIADNGSGIPPEIQSHIFEPFFTTKGVGQGTGLGLHIAYRVVVGQHQGDIKVVSQPGDTRFQVRLPLRLS
ncbi:MAG: cyclic nucleotide-binding domain-containing protein [Aphanothece sp. CMT-3BRIN-NPC111]|jgi:signal transduction histidine kinase|nr:cyclic nucleotide-binding domain-containing protein [Aphanothece sp. CMT-3BRIN-NPC111]